MTRRRGQPHLIVRTVLLAGAGLAISLSIAVGAAHRGHTSSYRGVYTQPNGGAWFVTERSGLGFRHHEAIYARDRADGGEDRVQTYNKNDIINFASGDRIMLYIFGDWGEPPARLGRFAARLDPAPVEPAPMTYEEYIDGVDQGEKRWRSYIERLEAGWPLRCLSAQVVGPKVDHTLMTESVYHGAARRPDMTVGIYRNFFLFGRLKGAIPYYPMPLGLVADTIFWALVLWAVIFGRGAARRWSRIRHGRCLWCGYDLSGAVSPICPECGNAACMNDDAECQGQSPVAVG